MTTTAGSSTGRSASGAGTLRSLGPSDRDEFRVVFLACWPDLVPSPESRERGPERCAADLATTLGSPAAVHLGHFTSGILDGILVGEPCSFAPQERALRFLAVMPDARGRGIAREMVRVFLGVSPRPAWVRTWDTNAAALGLYRSLGFLEESREPGHRGGGIGSVWLRHPGGPR